MDRSNYTLEWLESEFSQHANEVDRKWEDQNAFSVAHAMRLMCQEIQQIKKDLYEKSTPRSGLSEEYDSGCY